VLHAALGEALLAAGDVEGAREALAAAQRLAPGDVRAVRLLAEAYRRRGGAEVAQAEILYEIALGRLAPEHPAALLGKARLLLDRRALPEALAIAERVAAMASEASPRQRAAAHALRARALALAGRKEDAAAAERAALALDGAGREVAEILAAPVAAAGR
jgi:tetratricopeptide (TPR) repeat protein